MTDNTYTMAMALVDAFDHIVAWARKGVYAKSDDLTHDLEALEVCVEIVRDELEILE